MGSFKGYSLLIGSKSAGVERQHIRLSVFMMIPMVLIAGLVVLLFVVSTLGFGQIAWFNAQEKIEKIERDSLNKEINALKKQSQRYSDKLATIVSDDKNRRVIYGLSPIDSGALKAGIGGSPRKSQIAEENHKHPYIINALKLQETFELHTRQSIFIDSNLTLVRGDIEKKLTRMRQTPSIWPTAGRRTSEYGYRLHPVKGYRAFHDGLDIANTKWTPVIASADGIVKKAHMSTGGYGKVIEIKHGSSGFVTKYAHLEGMDVKKGQIVKRGQLIGFMGNTGRSTGDHLHYEVIKDGKLVDPSRYLIDKVNIAKK